MTSKLKTDVLETGSGSGTIALNNQLSGMTADSMPSGSVLQVVEAVSSGQIATTSTSFTASGVYVDITPKYTNSKMFIVVNLGGLYFSNGNSTWQVEVVRGGSTPVGHGPKKIYGYNNNGSSARRVPANYNLSDSPSTTSTVRYEIRFLVSAGTIEIGNNSATVNITATEIKG